MEQHALIIAQDVASRYIDQLGGDFTDGRTLVKAALAGFLCASGVPTDAAVQMVEELVAKMLVSPVPPNPMYHGLPWMVPGPASGAPYYR